MFLGRSQAVPDGREEETHPMGRFFTVFSEASGIGHWRQQYRGQCSDPVYLHLYSCYFLISYILRMIRRALPNFRSWYTLSLKVSVALLIFWIGDGREGDSAGQHVASAHRHMAILVVQMLSEDFLFLFFLNIWKNSSDIVCSLLTSMKLDPHHTLN